MNERIQYAFGESRLAPFLMATSNRGIVLFEFGRDRSALLADLHGRVPAAIFEEDGSTLADTVKRLAAVADGFEDGADLPLDPRGTEFERRVWDALRRIASGETSTYGAIAAALGQPRLTREVGEACAANAIALLVPCHRVVKKDGTLGNYRWGYAHKRALLQREARAAGVSR